MSKHHRYVHCNGAFSHATFSRSNRNRIADWELEQAARVLRGAASPRFVLGDFLESPVPKAFDAVVFAASVHYFPDLATTMGHAMSLLRPGGEVHVLEFTRENFADIYAASPQWTRRLLVSLSKRIRGMVEKLT